MKVLENYSLQAYNTFKIDVRARYFVEVLSMEDLMKALDFAKKNVVSILLLGGGSNVLFTKDYPGMVILINLKGISEKMLNDNEVLITVKAGENWHKLVQYCVSKNYGGIENLALIPGNAGTSPIQNIGAYGKEIKDVFESCKVLNLETLDTEIFDLEKCRFGYRDSLFKREGKGKFIILEVSFRLTTRVHKINIEYGAISSELKKMNVENPTIKEVSQAVIRIRESKLPNPKEIGNAGSFFKNPSINEEDFEKLKIQYPELHGYNKGSLVKIAAGWLIEQAGWKGKQVGNVATHHLQALVIINATGKATGKEIFDFSSKIIEEVKNKFGIELEREVNII